MRYVLAVLLFLVASTGYASEATTSGTLTVTASVSANCIIRSPIALDFGVYNPITQGTEPLDATGNVLSISCSNGAPGVTIGLDNGQNYAGMHRNLHGPDGDRVGYDIYTTADHSIVWTMIDTVSYVPTTSQATAVPVYGRVLGGQKARPGHYTDTLLAMVNF